ncbi:hypothetical protein [Salibacterium lacus]|uniref:Uncharacterized protein n=1 Tax=Salibacterium lacus TaxID=1898109 RepID=A0ABW5T3P2_9BACI
MNVTRKDTCEDCTHTIHWFYHVPQHKKRGLEWESKPSNMIGVKEAVDTFEQDGYKWPSKVLVYCSKCGYLNDFNVSY